MDQMAEGGVAIFVAQPEQHRSHDTNYPYRASSEVLYLSGFAEPEAVLVLVPGHEDGDFVMFVRDRDPTKEQWDGRRAGTAGAEDNYGADRAYTISQIDEILPTYLEGRSHLYYTFGHNEDFDQRVLGWQKLLRHKRNKPSMAPGNMRDARDILNNLRLLKTEEEIEVMRRAAVITAQAHEMAMRACKPGMHEYELQALIEFHFKRNGANFPAYSSIVGTGDNATILHYIENDAPLKDGDVLLIDAGCEYVYYAADITRSFPVNGKFSPAQKDLYQAVLDAQIHAVELCVPGLPYEQIQKQTAHRLTQSLVDLGLLSGDVDALYEDKAYAKYYPHSTGHWLGIDVHDVGAYHLPEGTSRPLEPGMILTIEPGLYIPLDDQDAPEEMRGVGIRIEDDILITASGHENLTRTCPKTVEDIEAIVGSGVELSF